jgi:hypothetical protein
MNLIHILLTALLPVAVPPNHQPSTHHIRARVTFYGGAPERVARPGVSKAHEGVVAAHPKYKFGTRLHIPALKGVVGDGQFEVCDRGSAVTARRASHGHADVIDVYVPTYSKLNRLASTLPEYLDVYF